MISNEFDKDTGLETRLSQKMGLKGSSTLNKFVHTAERELEDFEGLLVIIRDLFPDQEMELMEEYIKTLSPKKNTARMCLEYTQVNKMLESHKYLLDIMKDCGNAKSVEWAKLYQIDFDIANKEISLLDGFNKINALSLNLDETKAFAEICKYFIFYDLELIDSMQLITPILNSHVKKLEKGYIKKSYSIRYDAIESEMSLHKCELDNVRNSLQKIEDCENNYHKCLMYLTLGNSFIMESFDKGIDYMNKSLEIAKKNNYENRINQAQRSINFMQNYWGRIPHYLNEESGNISDIHEVAFFYIRQNNDKGLEVLNSIDLNILTDKQRGFHYFYKGLALNSKELFLKSVKYFSASGEKFYKNLSLIELKKHGLDEFVLDALGF